VARFHFKGFNVLIGVGGSDLVSGCQTTSHYPQPSIGIANLGAYFLPFYIPPGGIRYPFPVRVLGFVANSLLSCFYA
jgi:hypothetical protein